MDALEIEAAPHLAEKRIEELEVEVKIWKFAYTTAQTQIDAAEKGLIPLCAPGWKHDWIGDLVDGVKERIAELEAECDEWHSRAAQLARIGQAMEKTIIDAHMKAFSPPRNYEYVDAQTTIDLLVADIGATQHERASLIAENVSLREALEPFKHFADMWESKPLGKSGDSIYGIHFGTEWAAELTVTQMRNARTALTQPATTEALERVRRLVDIEDVERANT